MTLRNKLDNALNEKDVENLYRSELLKLEDASITSPYNVDGLLQAKNLRTLLEFKYDENLKDKLSQSNVLIQCLYYLKKFEDKGHKMPTTIFVGDINECFAIHTNSIIKYLSSEIDWRLAPSQAHKKNPELIKAMVGDTDILPFIYDINDKFSIKSVIEKLKDFSKSITRKVRVTKFNVVSIFQYFDKNVLGKVELTTNQKANLFIQIIINANENYVHPKRKNILITRHYGEIKVNSNLFNSFFSHFEGDLYSPKEKDELVALVDRLVEDTVRRNKGEFFTPAQFVNLAHNYVAETFGDDWKERFVVWDNSAGTLNLTRDFKFKELYCSTLEQSDLDTAEQMGYNPEATKFQYDFLNDSDDKLPQGLQDAINNGKEILFLINPPYARSASNGVNNKVKSGVSDTVVGRKMKKEKWGACSANIYAQFFYKITKYQEVNKNVKIGVFCKPNYLSSPSYKEFRKNLFNEFKYERGFLFQASHFSDVATQWGISFGIFSNNLAIEKGLFNHDLIDFDNDYTLRLSGTKSIYNLDNYKTLSKWILNKTKPSEFPKLSSYLTIKESKFGCELPNDCFATVVANSNSVYKNQTSVYIVNGGITENVGKNFVNSNTFEKCVSLFTARKAIKGNWINDKDEYLAPNEEHPLYEQFTYDSIVYSLFNNSSQQSSLRQVNYKDKKWDIKNEFFWMSKEEILDLAEENKYDEVYRDARTSDDRFVFKMLFEEGIYEKLSTDAKKVIDMATDLTKKSFEMRELMSESKSEYHLDSWDAGYAQLKLVWKEYFKDEFKEFRTAYKDLESRMRPLVYELGFLRK